MDIAPQVNSRPYGHGDLRGAIAKPIIKALKMSSATKKKRARQDLRRPNGQPYYRLAPRLAEHFTFRRHATGGDSFCETLTYEKEQCPANIFTSLRTLSRSRGSPPREGWRNMVSVVRRQIPGRSSRCPLGRKRGYTYHLVPLQRDNFHYVPSRRASRFNTPGERGWDTSIFVLEVNG